MALSNICNEAMEIEFKNTGGPPDNIGSSATAGADDVSVTQASYCKIFDKKICTKEIIVTWNPTTPCPFSASGFTFEGGGGSVTATAAKVKVKVEGQAVLLEGDTGTCTGSWKDPNNVSVSCACTVKISSAGQDKVKAQ
jgi:hypothetical protein